jgi:hypothetical protein
VVVMILVGRRGWSKRFVEASRWSSGESPILGGLSVRQTSSPLV